MIFGILLALAAHADEIKLPHYQNPLLHTKQVETKESIVELNGAKFRKVEYKGEKYYLQIIETAHEGASAQMYCEKDSPVVHPSQTISAVKITTRNKVFVEGLKQTCVDIGNGKKQVAIDPTIAIGFYIGDKPKDFLQKKRILLMPTGIGFAGDM
jgi:hypothetical protein